MNKLAPLLVMLLFASAANAFTVTAPEKTINVPTLGARDIIIPMASDRDEMVAVNLIDSPMWTSLNQNLVSLEAGRAKELVLTLAPFEDTVIGSPFQITLLAESLTTKQQIKKYIYVTVYKGNVIDIEKIIVSGDPKPLGYVRVDTIVKNYKTVLSGSMVINGMINSPSGKIFDFREVVDNINPDQRVTVSKTFSLGKYAEAGTYKVVTSMTADGETREVTQTFNVASRAIIVTTEDKSAQLFGFSKTITVTNDGNAEEPTVTVEQSVSQFEGVFFNGDVPTFIDNGKYAWLIRNVAPGSFYTVEYSIDYTPLFMFIAALLILFWIILFKLRTVRVKKYIIQKKELEEGEEFTVGIEVKNASGRKVDEVTVTDFVPPIFELRDFQGLSPAKKKTAAGTELSWKLKSVHHKEERLVSYRIVPLFGVHGQIRLPRASVSYKQGKRDMRNRSTYASIGIATDIRIPKRKKK